MVTEEKEMHEDQKKWLKMYLDQYMKKKERKRSLERRLKNFRIEMLGTKEIRYSDMPKSQTNNIIDEPLEFRIKCEEIEESIRKEQRESASAMLKVMDILAFLDADSPEKEIMEYKYLDGYKWRDIERITHRSHSGCISYWNKGMDKLLEYKYVRTAVEKYKKDVESATGH